MGADIETARGTIHSWQCDHMAHANLRAYSDLFEQALWHVFTHIGITPSLLRSGSLAMAGVQQNISYRRELYPGDTVAVRSHLSDFQARRLTMIHEMINSESGEICATCELTAVCLDPTARRPREFPEHIATKAREWLESQK